MRPHRHTAALITLVAVFVLAICAPAYGQTSAQETGKPAPAALVIAGKRVLTLYSRVGSFSPDERIEAARVRLQGLLKNPEFEPESIRELESPAGTDVVAGNVIIVTVTDADAAAAGKPRQQLARDYVSALRFACARDIKARPPGEILVSVLFSLIATVLLVAVLAVLGRIFPRLYGHIRSWKGRYIRPLKIQKAVLLSEDAAVELLITILSIGRLLLVLAALYAYIAIVLGFFAGTRELSEQIVNSFTEPLTQVVWPAITGYLPKLLFLALIAVGARYAIAFTSFIFKEIESGSIEISGFWPDWADATYKIARFLIISFAAVLAVPYLPGSGSPAFQQVGLFLGVLFSLASTGTVSHVVAGIFLTYAGAFKIGDRVKIADTVGDVVEKTLLATRIRTIKNEFITVPNGLVLGSHIINYSTSALNPGLILHTTVTIGYNARWQTVEHLLIEAARATEHILEHPTPFVLQTSLNDFHISYEINAYTNSPEIMANTYAELHRNIQNKFNEAGVEIMSPGYSAVREGNATTVPEEYLPADYAPPPFHVSGALGPAAAGSRGKPSARGDAGAKRSDPQR